MLMENKLQYSLSLFLTELANKLIETNTRHTVLSGWSHLFCLTEIHLPYSHCNLRMYTEIFSPQLKSLDLNFDYLNVTDPNI